MNAPRRSVSAKSIASNKLLLNVQETLLDKKSLLCLHFKISSVCIKSDIRRQKWYCKWTVKTVVNLIPHKLAPLVRFIDKSPCYFFRHVSKRDNE